MRYQISSKLSKPMLKLNRIWGGYCLICVALLQGCAATSPSSLIVSPVLPSRPSLSTPTPAQPYSKQWQQEVSAWQNEVQSSQQKLMATQLMR